jgi:hypothetical protein
MQKPEPHAEHDFEEPISDGPTPAHAISRSGKRNTGLRVDFDEPIETTPEKQARITDKILGN